MVAAVWPIDDIETKILSRSLFVFASSVGVDVGLAAVGVERRQTKTATDKSRRDRCVIALVAARFFAS